MKPGIAVVVVLLAVIGWGRATAAGQGPREVSFDTADGGRVTAHLYGDGARAVVLAHGKVFNKESWQPFAKRLAAQGYRVLAIDFRGYGKSLAGDKGQALDEDVLAAVRYLRADGARSLAVIGGSMGGRAAAQAATRSRAGEIDKLVLLSPAAIDQPERMRAGAFLFVASTAEPLAATVKQQYQRAPQPKRLELLDGSAHAQHIFAGDQGEALTELILGFLSDS